MKLQAQERKNRGGAHTRSKTGTGSSHLRGGQRVVTAAKAVMAESTSAWIVPRQALKLFPVVFHFRFGQIFPTPLLKVIHLSRYDFFSIVQDKSPEELCPDGKHAECILPTVFPPSWLQVLVVSLAW